MKIVNFSFSQLYKPKAKSCFFVGPPLYLDKAGIAIGCNLGVFRSDGWKTTRFGIYNLHHILNSRLQKCRATKSCTGP